MDPSDYERHLAVEYCASHGIPLSIFLGRVPKPGESYWLAEDRSVAMHWQFDEERRCSDCGKFTDETVGDENFDKWNARIVGKCDACYALQRARFIAAGRDDLDETAGLRFEVWRDSEPAT